MKYIIYSLTESLVNLVLKQFNMENKNIISLIDTLKVFTETIFEEKSIDDLKEIREKIIATIELIHGRRSFNIRNYQMMPIEKELSIIHKNIRKTILDKIIKKDYSTESIEQCFTDFDFSNEQEYSEYSGNGKEVDWDGMLIASQAKNHICYYLFPKLKKVLSRDISTQEKTESLEYLSKIKDRYNGSCAQYKRAEAIILMYDTEKKLEKSYL